MRKVGFKKYAKALLGIGKEQGVLDQLMLDLNDVSSKINENDELKKALLDIRIGLAQKNKILKAIFQDFISEKTYNFILLLIKNKRLIYLDSIIEVINSQSLKEDDIFEVTAETVVPITVEQNKKLQSVLLKKINKKVIIKNLIDSSLIGGMRIKINDQVIDSTVVGKISRLREIINKL